MMGHNNPMAIENWCDKMEFQGRGAAHIHGVAWCNLVKVSQVLDMEDREPPSEDEFEDDDDGEDCVENDKEREFINSSNDNEGYSEGDHGAKSELERAFEKLRNNETLKKEEEKALAGFADKFVTCTLNPDMAAKMIDENTSLSDGREIVKKSKETQTHHHTKTCKKHSPECRFGIPRFPMWKTMLSRPVKGATAEEQSDRRIKHKEVLKSVLEVLENGEQMDEIWKDYDKNIETRDEYKVNRKQIILKVLELSKDLCGSCTRTDKKGSQYYLGQGH